MADLYDPPPASPSEWWTSVPRGRVLVFSPHPDDEVLGPGGALCLHRRQGDPVRIVIATDGVAGDADRNHEPAAYSALRRQESAAGLRALDIDDARYWGLPDSCVLSASDLELATRLAAKELQDYGPDLVYLPWQQEGHPDHHALHVAVMRAFARLGFAGQALGYEMWNAAVPDVVVDITAVAAQKRAAIECHRSQLQHVDLLHLTFGLNAYRTLGHARGVGFGEGYVRLWPRR